MKLATSQMISKIDEFAKEKLGIPTETLMERSGEAVARAVRDAVAPGREVIILAGKGNNGGDGYAAATKLMSDYKVTVYDIFSKGQKNKEGKHFLDEYVEKGGEIVNFAPTPEIISHIKGAGCIIDAVFGTGFHGDMPEDIRPLAIAVAESVEAYKIAVDVPLGINADNGEAGDFATFVDATVELSFIKPGIVSYPARSYVGKIIYDDLGLPLEKIVENFSFKYKMIEKKWIDSAMPKREENSNKGSFGKLLLITGSEKYRGAAHLSLEAALRGGVGLVTYLGEEELISQLSQKFPEAIYKKTKKIVDIDHNGIEEIVELSKKHSATLIGSGSDNTDGLLALTLALLGSEGGPIILDADAINALALIKEEGREAIRNSKREVIITPHPLEFARLAGDDVANVQRHRLECAERFAKENSCIVALKGAGTIITDGNVAYINGIGSSALAKAGSGDVLAGFIGAFIAQSKISSANAVALAVYYHAKAGESLAEEFSAYGVTPSDLPKEIARQIAKANNR